MRTKWFNILRLKLFRSFSKFDRFGARISLFFERKQEGGFEKGWFGRMYPRSGFWYGGTSDCSLIQVFSTGEHPNVPSFLFLVQGNIAKTTLFETTLLRTPDFSRVYSKKWTLKIYPSNLLFLPSPKTLLRLFFRISLARQKITSNNKNKLARLFLRLVFKDILGGFLKITPE